MSQVNLKFAELHNPLFLNGTNLNLKLDIKNRPALRLYYDRTERLLFVYFNNGLAIVPLSNVSSMTPVNAKDFGFENIPEVPAAPIPERPMPEVVVEMITNPDGSKRKSARVVAQNTSPTSHVFNGPGSGDTGQTLHGPKGKNK